MLYFKPLPASRIGFDRCVDRDLHVTIQSISGYGCENGDDRHNQMVTSVTNPLFR